MQSKQVIDNPAQNGDQPTPDNTSSRPPRYKPRHVPEVILTELHMAVLFWFTRFEYVTVETMLLLLQLQWPHLTEREVSDLLRLMFDLGYVAVIPQPATNPNVYQLAKRGAGELLAMGADKDHLSVYKGAAGYLQHKVTRDYIGVALTRTLMAHRPTPCDLDLWSRKYPLFVPKTERHGKFTIYPDAFARIPNDGGGLNHLPIEIDLGTMWWRTVVGPKIERHLLFHRHLPKDLPERDRVRSLFITVSVEHRDKLVSLAQSSPHLWFHQLSAIQHSYQTIVTGWVAGDGSTDHLLTEGEA
jgi:hypothetical protein